MAANVRQRHSYGQKSKEHSHNHGHDHAAEKRKERSFIGASWLCFFVALDVLLICISHYERDHYPTPQTLSSAKPGQFVEETARRHLEQITAIGSRPVGSPENEIHTVAYLLKELEDIKLAASPANNVQIQTQTVTGSFSIKFLGGFSSYYENVKNILVKLSPKKAAAENSLLVNCHYDSVINGTGASDDAISCCLMLEVLRVLSISDSSLTHNIVFIFNGAEENILQASHGFITKHEWAKDLRAFVNLDAAGAGGKELLFQAGPDHPWMIHTYAEHAPHPFASVIGQEIFESGVIPSDTDYRIFRDYGKISGLDIAYISNGYVYHTPYDTADKVAPGCIQRGGDNLLGVVRAMANSPYLPDPGEYRHGKLVFFDVIGRFMVVYPARIGQIFNTIVCVAAIFGVIINFKPRTTGGLSGTEYIREIIQAVSMQLFSWLVCVVVTIALATGFDACGLTMSWFTNTWLLLGLYAAPALLSIITVHRVVKSSRYQSHKNMWHVEQVYFDATMLIFAGLSLTLTYLKVNSVVCLVLWVLFPFVIRDRIAKLLEINPKDDPSAFMCLHTTSVMFPSLMTVYCFYSAYTMFIPIMGRAGAEVIPDILMGIIMAFAVIILFSHHVGLLYVSKGVGKLQFILLLTFITSVCVVIFTPLGFPYSANESQPTKQRHILHHMMRTFHDQDGSLISSDSGIIHVPFDRNQLRFLPESELGALEKTKCHSELPYCGWPFYFPLLPVLRDTYWVPSPPLEASPPGVLTLTERLTDGNTETLTFNATGPSHLNVYFSPRPGVSLLGWSLEDPPEPTDMPADVAPNRKNYFIYYSYGIAPENPWSFQLQFLKSAEMEAGDAILDIALGAHYLTVDEAGEQKLTPTLDSYIRSMPNWTIPIGWAVTYASWIY